MEPEHDFSGDDSHGEDVPAFFGDEVDDDEVDLGAAVGDKLSSAVASDAGAVDLGGLLVGGGFDLDFAEATSGVDDEVVAVAVAVGFGKLEAHGGGLVEKSEFGEFSATLGFARGPW